MKTAKPSVPRTLSRKDKQAELRDLLKRYELLSTNPAFSRACRKIDKHNVKTADKIGDRSDFSKAVVAFYLKWNVYPIPEYLVNYHNFRVCLEQLYLRQGRVKWIPVSPLTSKDEFEHYYRQLKRVVGGPKKLSNLSKLRDRLFHDHLVHHSAFHGFNSSDFAVANGSKSRRGKAGSDLSEKELTKEHQLFKQLQHQGVPYLAADARAHRAVLKKRWREPKRAPNFRMSIRRALSNLKSLISKPNK